MGMDSGNQLNNTIPSELWQLTSLFKLDLSLNSLSGSIPPGISGLSNINVIGTASKHSLFLCARGLELVLTALKFVRLVEELLGRNDC